ncbi:MAG: 2-oxoacid:acceptor oxidoreductase subunit alpha [Candidatus Aminicenantes bacterium]
MNKNYCYQEILHVLGKKEQFIQGDEAVAYGALLAGCTYFAGYPITPASETAEIISRLIPRLGGVYIQMEDEIASISAVIGAAWTGAKAMTATSGPGFSLMMENIGYACMTETPCVIVDIQRSGPSTGQPTEPSQGDMMQARWGTHGDHEIIALAPSSVQECLDLTIEAFNLSEKYRNPVLVMTDGEVGHMRENVSLPAEKEIRLVERRRPRDKKEDYIPFKADETKISCLPDFGQGYHIYVTGLTHDQRGFPATDDAHEHTRLVKRLCEKISDRSDELTRVEWDSIRGAEVGMVSYGITSRAAISAAHALRKKGVKVNHLRLVAVWPFPEKEVYALAEQVKAIFVPEMNLGQIVHPLREAARGKCEVISLPKIGGIMHTPKEIMEAVKNG